MKAKPVRVNLSTKTEDIIATMREELPKAEYFFRKQFGGKQKYLDYEDKLLDKALDEEQDQLTDIDYYISPVGNRWMTYTHVMYFPKAKYAHAFHYSFIYYETLGSCGAFFPSYSPAQMKDGLVKKNGKPDEVIVFTDHFFYQMSERTGIEYRSKELIKKFVSEKCENMMSADEEGDVIAKFKGGHGFGKELTRNPRKVEVRTYLTDGQLSNKQKRKCEAVDTYYEIMKDGMFIKNVSLNTALWESLNPKEAVKDADEQFDAIKKLGLEKHLNMAAGLTSGFVKLLEYTLHVKINLQQTAIIAHTIGNEYRDMVMKYVEPELPISQLQAEFENDLIELYAKCARLMKLKSVTRERIKEWWDNLKRNTEYE